MKKGWLILNVALLAAITFAFVLNAEAGSSGTVAVKVTVAPTISINIAEGTLSLGSVAAGSSTVSSAAVTVTNDGSGINETYSLSLSDPSGWTASQTAAGSETYVLNAAFSNVDSAITWSESDHALSTTPVACSSTKFAGDQTGDNVPYNADRKLWFKFLAPTSTTVNTEQSIVITITAAAS